MAKKKKKESFKTFHNLEKSKFKTIKTTLKSILLNHAEIQPLITNIVVIEKLNLHKTKNFNLKFLVLLLL